MKSKNIIVIIIGVIIVGIGIIYGIDDSQSDVIENLDEKIDLEIIGENDEGKHFSLELTDAVTASGP